MKNTFLLLLTCVFLACSSKKTTEPKPATDDNYGYAEKNPINVGGLSGTNQRMYLNSLTGPNGEPLSFERLGSCCQFETKNSPWGMGMLDIYLVTYAGKNDTVKLYLNAYDRGELKAPAGFRLKL